MNSKVNPEFVLAEIHKITVYDYTTNEVLYSNDKLSGYKLKVTNSGQDGTLVIRHPLHEPRLLNDFSAGIFTQRVLKIHAVGVARDVDMGKDINVVAEFPRAILDEVTDNEFARGNNVLNRMTFLLRFVEGGFQPNERCWMPITYKLLDTEEKAS